MNENEIESWQEAISALPEKSFFNTMRLYLGEIKTPYNKQRLIAALASFIKNEKNTNAILTLLDETDVKILTAISLISKVTQETLVDFFKGTFLPSEIFSEIINLQERLIIYTRKDSYSEKKFLFINPLLKDNLNSYLDINLLFPIPQIQTPLNSDIFVLSPNFLASFISYIKIKGINCKSDGTLKKNDITKLETIFPKKTKCIQLLTNAFVNLSLLKENEKGFELDDLRLENFANFLPEIQYALLTAASVSRFSVEGLKKEAQLLLDVLSSVPKSGFLRDEILKIAFLIGSSYKTENSFTKSRFSKILADARNENGNDASQSADILDRMIDSCIEFGLLVNVGKNSENQEIYQTIELNQNFNDDENPKVLNVDATFFITIMPGLSLKKLLPLTNFLLIKKCEVVTEFEITKKSVSFGFDRGQTPNDIFLEMEKYSYYELPQNLKINILEWFSSFSSAVLYHGYVLKVQDKNISFVENNPNIKKYLKEKLAEGIYLLNIPYDKEISSFINESGIDFLGKVREPKLLSEHTTFPNLTCGKKTDLFEKNANKKIKKTSMENAINLIKSLKSALKNKNIDENHKTSLEHRISARMILSLEQLEIANIRTEIFEADGIDFSGKIHLIDAAIKEKEMIEIEMPEASGNGNFFTIVGMPLFLSKQVGEAILRFQVEPSKECITILVSRISHVKRLIF